MESFAATFPRVALDSGFKGWFVSTLLLLAWAGSLVNGPVADRFGRKGSILIAVIIFTIGSVLQAAAVNIPMAFVGMSAGRYRRNDLTRSRTGYSWVRCWNADNDCACKLVSPHRIGDMLMFVAVDVYVRGLHGCSQGNTRCFATTLDYTRYSCQLLA